MARQAPGQAGAGPGRSRVPTGAAISLGPGFRRDRRWSRGGCRGGLRRPGEACRAQAPHMPSGGKGEPVVRVWTRRPDAGMI